LDAAYVEWQLARFTAVIDELTAQGIDIPVRLAASSPLALHLPQAYLNAVAGEARPPVPLPPAFHALKTRLIEVKELTPRARFAEAAPFPIERPLRLGVVPMGSADGILFLHAGRRPVR